MSISRRDTSSFFKDLTSLLTGSLILPEDVAYDEVRQLWSGKVNKRPAVFVRCADAQDVVHTVRWARSHGMKLSVRGGGHDFAGRALCEGGIVIDCSQMRTVTIDPEARIARVQGGTTAGDLIEASLKDGLWTTTGSVSDVGLAGLTLGGGYGPLMCKYGLIADNLLSAQVVTADGQLLTASATENEDLFWGLRGGGGNFGVVVSLEYRLYPISQVLSGLLLYPLDQAREALSYYREFMETVPDELTIQPGFVQLPDSPLTLYFAPTYCGPLAEGERVLKPLRTFGHPLADLIQPTTYNALINALNPLVPKGRHYFAQTQSLDTLSSEIIDLLIEHAQQFTSPFSMVPVHHFRGVPSRVGASETAFVLRQEHFMVEIVAGWEPQSPQEDQRHVQWAREFSHVLAPHALKGGYINMLGEEEQERVPAAFGSNYERLLNLKRTYDPDDVFHSTIGHIKPVVS